MKYPAIASLALLLACGATLADDLPREISGRWTWAARNATQTFSLENIERKGDGAFAANLTWWTMDSKCAIRSQPLTGKVTDAGLSFEAKTKCDVAFTAELHRAGKGWEGKATTQAASGTPIVIDMKAN